MNAIEQLLFILNLLAACSAQPATEMRIGQQDYVVQEWICSTDTGSPMQLKAYRRQCEGGNQSHYPGRAFYFEFDHPAAKGAEYMNRFGGIDVGEGAQLQDSYVPLCS